MKMRLTPPTAARGAWVTAGRSAAGALLLALSVAACTSSGSTAPSIFTPSAPVSSSSAGATRTPSPASGATLTVRPTPTASAKPGGSATVTLTARPSAPASSAPAPRPTRTAPAPRKTVPLRHYPTTAPQTGGGGTAGVQDGVVFGAGGLAVLAGLGSLAFRRRLARKIGASEQGPARDRTPADR